MNPNILISLEALASMIKYDLSIKGKETAGLLIGMEVDGIVHIDEVRIGPQEANAVHVEITTEELIAAATDISMREDGKSIVGWIHTHPGLSAFLSPTDVTTQQIYQALMPNAVAIVVDAVKYSHTLELNDLDLGVFRVENNKAVRQDYQIKESTEFGLRTFISSDLPVQTAHKPMITQTFTPIVDPNQLIIMKANVDKLLPEMGVKDVNAIKAWIELAEAMQSGVYKEVPIDVGNLSESLVDSIDRLDDNLVDIEFEMSDKGAQKGMLVIFLGAVIEFVVFYFFFILN